MAKAKPLAQGILADGHVVVRDVSEANRLHNKALAGEPQKGNTLRLSLVEAAHCLANGWLAVRGEGGNPLGLPDLLQAGRHHARRAEVEYIVYHDLRERGLVARHGQRPGRFDVWPRGTGQGPPAYRVLAAAETEPALAADLAMEAGQEAQDATATPLVACVVDSDGDVTHYTLSQGLPKGTVTEATLPDAQGAVLSDHVLVTDATAAAAYRAQHLGTPHGGGVLLSFVEAEALRRRGVLRVDDTAWSAATVGRTDLARVLPAYLALRRAGAVPKSGFRFGTDLRAYEGDPDATHAPWLLHCARTDEAVPWSLLSRGVRLAHGVRKEFLLAVTQGEDVTFVRLAWFRP